MFNVLLEQTVHSLHALSFSKVNFIALKSPPIPSDWQYRWIFEGLQYPL